MQTARYIDSFREIKRSLGRYFSIMLIVALGCGFFSGLKATMPDMVDGAKSYFKETKLMDYRLMSSIGIKSEDVEAVRKADGVRGAAPGYAKDVFYTYNNKSCVLKVMSISDTLKPGDKNYLNAPVVLEGRLPERSGECVVERKMSSPSTFEVGNTLKLDSAYEDEDILSTFRTDTFEIVGIVTSPLYIGYDRDATDVGSGEVLSYIMVGESDFVSDYYTEMFISLDGLEDYEPFSDEYRDAVREKKQAACEAFRQSINDRYKGMSAIGERDISSAEKTKEMLEHYLSLDSAAASAELEKINNKISAIDKSIEDTLAAGKSDLFLQAERSQLTAQTEMLKSVADEDETKLSDYRVRLAALKRQIKQMRAFMQNTGEPVIYEFDRFDSSEDYSSYYNDSSKIDKLSTVFPVFFILVAALVCLTTMTRMVDDERTIIGTYKALGYSGLAVSFKFLFYCISASLIGSVAGTAIGLQVFPKIIYECYKILYNIPKIETPFRVSYCVGCAAVSVICTVISVLWACGRALRAQPAELMRPKAPPIGRRVLFERIPSLWDKLSFLSKVTIRNLLRYKKRFVMTIVGVAGCTALIMTGFGLKYSIGTIAERQFTDIWHYDGIIAYDTAKGCETAEYNEQLSAQPHITDFLPFKKYMAQSEDTEGSTVTADVVIPDDISKLSRFVEYKSVDDEIDWGGENVIITDKLSKLTGVKKGDTISLSIGELGTFDLKVGGVMKNYIMHYVYVDPEYFESLTGQTPVYNMAYFISDEKGEALDKLKADIIKNDHFLGVSLKLDTADSFMDSLSSLDAVVVMLIVCAGFLATVVLYNLANINITERSRELATLKVLGFYDKETSAYIYRENIAGMVIGILAGFVLGIILHRVVVITSEVDLVMFNRSLVWYSYVYAALITAVFTFIVNLVMHFKIKRIDEVGSLKYVE
ncbi:MAG: ABC transporter permease [Ruminococcus sp.]|nr:ABC transporter permease [Ruminococcus sp.]